VTPDNGDRSITAITAGLRKFGFNIVAEGRKKLDHAYVDFSASTLMSDVNDRPTCSLTPVSVTLTGATSQTSTLTVNTTAAMSANSQIKKFFWPSMGGTAQALVFFLVPRRRHNWIGIVGLLLLLVSLGVNGCGGGSTGGGGGGGNSGTTAGSYTVTVTGTSGSISAKVGSISLTVQ